MVGAAGAGLPVDFFSFHDVNPCMDAAGCNISEVRSLLGSHTPACPVKQHALQGLSHWRDMCVMMHAAVPTQLLLLRHLLTGLQHLNQQPVSSAGRGGVHSLFERERDRYMCAGV